MTASRITSRNASVFWESERNMDMVFTFLKNKKETDGSAILNWTVGLIFSLGTDMPPRTSFGTKCTKASMRCFGNILYDENLFGNAVVRS